MIKQQSQVNTENCYAAGIIRQVDAILGQKDLMGEFVQFLPTSVSDVDIALEWQTWAFLCRYHLDSALKAVERRLCNKMSYWASCRSESLAILTRLANSLPRDSLDIAMVSAFRMLLDRRA